MSTTKKARATMTSKRPLNLMSPVDHLKRGRVDPSLEAPVTPASTTAASRKCLCDSKFQSNDAVAPLTSRKRLCDSKFQSNDAVAPLTSRKRLCDNELRTNDEIHGTIRFCAVLQVFLATPQMQRLRGLKQLGTSINVYMNADHTRFSHSLGVMRLAERVLERISKNQPKLQVTRKDMLCVKLAAMFHDLGHGPFSHVFERFTTEAFPAYFETLPANVKAKYDNLPKVPDDYKGHEQVSLRLIDDALAHLGLAVDLDNLDQKLREIGDSGYCASSLRACFDNENDEEVLTSRDLVFVKECIWGKPIAEIERATGEQGFIGRPQEKEWLYDIVCNRHSGLDVDKVDYYARDQRRCLGHGQVDEVIVEEPVVAWIECPEQQRRLLSICYPEKLSKAIIHFFNTRYELHSTIYCHKTTVAAAHMVNDILCRADPYFFRLSTNPFGGGCVAIPKSNAFLPPSRAICDGAAYLRLRDSIIDEIANSTNPEMQEARELAERYLARDLYKCVAEYPIDRQSHVDLKLWQMSEEDIKSSLLEFWQGTRMQGAFSKTDMIVDKFTIHKGQKRQNPTKNIRVVPSAQYSQLKNDIGNLPLAKPVDLSKYQAQTTINQDQPFIRIYSRDSTKRSQLETAFRQWIADFYEPDIHLNTTPFLDRIQTENMATSAIISQQTPQTE